MLAAWTRLEQVAHNLMQARSKKMCLVLQQQCSITACCTHCYEGFVGAWSDSITGGQGHAMSTLLSVSIKKVVDSRITRQLLRTWVARSSFAVALQYNTPMTQRSVPAGGSEFLDPYIKTLPCQSCARWEHVMSC